ncbi:MAG: hypothetical protein AB2705_22320 [Candidatus Thiodiazotropha sp.]
MSLSTVKFNQIEEELNDAIEWLTSLGVVPNRGRFGLYNKTLQKLFRSHKEDRNQGYSDFPKMANAIYEVFDLIEIHKGLSDISQDEISKLANFYQKGVEEYTKENPDKSGNMPRNTAFELLISSKLHVSNIDIDLTSISDTSGQFENNHLLVECKRLQSENNIQRNIKDAKSQLKKKIFNPVKSRTCGVIALDFTKLLNPDFGLLVKNNEEEAQEWLNSATDHFIKEYQKYWTKSLGRNILGVLTYFSLLAVIEDKMLLTHCKQYAFCHASDLTPRWKDVSWRFSQKLGATSKEVLVD